MVQLAGRQPIHFGYLGKTTLLNAINWIGGGEYAFTYIEAGDLIAVTAGGKPVASLTYNGQGQIAAQPPTGRQSRRCSSPRLQCTAVL